MLQRIQSLYLLMTTILPLLFLKGSFLKFINNTGYEILMKYSGIYQTNVDKEPLLIRQMIPVAILIILIPVVSFIAIFIYKKRKIQMKIVLAVIILSIILIGFIFYNAFSATNGFNAVLVPTFNMFVPLLVLIFGILAYSGIRKDEKLVASYDRLR